MTAEVIDCTRRNLGEFHFFWDFVKHERDITFSEEAMNHSERRMLFRRSRSEPMALTNEKVMMTSRT